MLQGTDRGADRALVVDVQNERIRLQSLSRPGHNVSMSSSEGSLPQDARYGHSTQYTVQYIVRSE